MTLTSARAFVVAGVVCCTINAASFVEADFLLSGPDRNTDYARTMAIADRESALMVVYFCDDDDPLCQRFDEELASSAAIRNRLSVCRCVCLSMDAAITSAGQRVRLIEHPVFSELEGRPGLVVLDFTLGESSERGRVLRSLPFDKDRGFKAGDHACLPRRSDKTHRALRPMEWMSDYGEATARAEREGRMLLIYFQCQDGDGGCAEFENKTLTDPKVRSHLSSYVCLKLAQGAKVNLEDTETVLLKHTFFSEMVGLPGIAIVDFSDSDAPYFGQVVSTFPLLRGKAYDAMQMDVILNLPPGKLTQRTLIYAVRTHPDAPQSTSGQLDPILISEAESHSAHQARIRLQGHHSWESRFHRINRRLPGGLLAAEVCAESWPGENLLEAAIDCVHCWRLSSGHWRSVRAAHPIFGYDMRRGSNGIWYATGIFGKRGR